MSCRAHTNCRAAVSPEKPVLKLMFGALIRAAERWRGLAFTEFELRQVAAVRKSLMLNTRQNSSHEADLPTLAFPANPRLDQQAVEAVRKMMSPECEAEFNGCKLLPETVRRLGLRPGQPHHF